jgi:hypothetical protein
MKNDLDYYITGINYSSKEFYGTGACVPSIACSKAGITPNQGYQIPITAMRLGIKGGPKTIKTSLTCEGKDSSID